MDIRIDMPSDNDRFLIMQEHLSHVSNNIDPQDLLMLARVASGFVSSDIAQIIRNSHMRAIKNEKKELTL